MTTLDVIEGLKNLKLIQPKVRGREISDYGLLLYEWGGGQVLAELKIPRMKNDRDFAMFIVKDIPYKATAEFLNIEDLELIFTGKKVPEFMFEDEGS